MKTCHEVERSISDRKIDDEVLKHLENCESCQLYFDLHSFEQISGNISETDILHAVSTAIDTAEIKQSKRNMLSLIAFMCLAAIILITIYTLTYSSLIDHMRRYLLAVSGIMPFTLPIFELIKRKVVLK